MKLNGKEESLENLNVRTVRDLLLHLKLENIPVAVEINGEIISSPLESGQELKESDDIELIHFVGGG